jgi:drug/metabolite transporter (DMT)-like permease
VSADAGSFEHDFLLERPSSLYCNNVTMASVALYVLLCLIWGSTWLVIKVGYGGLGPFTVAALRFLLAGTALAAILPIVGARWPSGRREWLLVVWVGVVLFAATTD